MATHEKEWVIIFLIYADFRLEGTGLPDNDLIRELQSMYKDIENCFLAEGVEILIIRNTITPNESGENFFDITNVSIAIRNQNGEPNEIVELESIDTPSTLQKHETLGEFFKKIHANHYNNAHNTNNIKNVITKAKHYFLITWDHGSAFGIFRQDVVFRILPARKQIFVNNIVDVEGNTIGKSLFEMKQQPLNRVKIDDQTYAFKERIKDSPIYNYFTADDKLIFQLNTARRSHGLVQRIIENRLVNTNLNISVSKKNILLHFSGEQSIRTITDELIKIDFSRDDIDFLVKNNISQNQFIKIELFSEKLIDILTNDELGKAIIIGFADKHIDVLLMMNCTMFNMHSCFAFKTTVDFLVAPQSAISEPGYNYSFLLNQISDNVEVNARRLAELCVISCGYELWEERKEFKEKIDTWIIFAMDLKDYDLIANMVDRLGTDSIAIFRENNGDPHYIFDSVRERCIRFDDPSSYYYMIDITHWLPELIIELHQKSIDVIPLINCYFTISDFLENNICAQRIGQEIYSPSSHQMIKRRPRGCSIYFPQEIDETEEEYQYFIDTNSPYQSSLIADKPNWLKFLLKDLS